MQAGCAHTVDNFADEVQFIIFSVQCARSSDAHQTGLIV